MLQVGYVTSWKGGWWPDDNSLSPKGLSLDWQTPGSHLKG